MKNFTFEDLHRYVQSLPADRDRISLEHPMHAGLSLDKKIERYHLILADDRRHLDLVVTSPGCDRRQILGLTFTVEDDEAIVILEDGSGNTVRAMTDFPVNSRSSRFEKLTRFPSDVLLRFMAQAELKSPTLNDLFRYLQGAEETSSHTLVLPDDLRDQFELRLNFVRDNRRCGISIYHREPEKGERYVRRIGSIRFIASHGTEATRQHVEGYIDSNDESQPSAVRYHSFRVDGIRLVDLFELQNETDVSMRENAHRIREILLRILQPMVDRSMTYGPTLVDLYALISRSVDHGAYHLESVPVQLPFIDKPDTDETTRQVNLLDANRNQLFIFLFRMCRGELSVTMINVDDEHQPQRCSMETVPGTMRLSDLRLPVSCDPTKAETILQLIAAVTWNYILS